MVLPLSSISTKLIVILALCGLSPEPIDDGSFGSVAPWPTLLITDSMIPRCGSINSSIRSLTSRAKSFVASMSVPIGNSIKTLTYFGSFIGKKMTFGVNTFSNSKAINKSATVPKKNRYIRLRATLIVTTYQRSRVGSKVSWNHRDIGVKT